MGKKWKRWKRNFIDDVKGYTSTVVTYFTDIPNDYLDEKFGAEPEVLEKKKVKLPDVYPEATYPEPDYANSDKRDLEKWKKENNARGVWTLGQQYYFSVTAWKKFYSATDTPSDATKDDKTAGKPPGEEDLVLMTSDTVLGFGVAFVNPWDFYRLDGYPLVNVLVQIRNPPIKGTMVLFKNMWWTDLRDFYFLPDPNLEDELKDGRPYKRTEYAKWLQRFGGETVKVKWGDQVGSETLYVPPPFVDPETEPLIAEEYLYPPGPYDPDPRKRPPKEPKEEKEPIYWRYGKPIGTPEWGLDPTRSINRRKEARKYWAAYAEWVNSGKNGYDFPDLKWLTFYTFNYQLDRHWYEKDAKIHINEEGSPEMDYLDNFNGCEQKWISHARWMYENYKEYGEPMWENSPFAGAVYHCSLSGFDQNWFVSRHPELWFKFMTYAKEEWRKWM